MRILVFTIVNYIIDRKVVWILIVYHNRVYRALRCMKKIIHVAGLYNRKRQTVDIIKLNGSVELGPIVELSDVIVDIVETGSTLKANRLKVLEEVLPISARMIVNPVSMQMKTERIREMIDRVRDCLQTTE